MPRRRRRNRLNPVVITGLVIAGAMVLAFAGVNAGWLKTQLAGMPVAMEGPVAAPVEQQASAPIAQAPAPPQNNPVPTNPAPVLVQPASATEQVKTAPLPTAPVPAAAPAAAPKPCDQFSFFSRLLRAAVLQPCTKSAPAPAAPPAQLNQVPAPGALPWNANVPPVAVTLPNIQPPDPAIIPNPADPATFTVTPVQSPLASPPTPFVGTIVGTIQGWWGWITGNPSTPIVPPCIACTGGSCPNPGSSPPFTTGESPGFFSRTWQSVTELSRQIRSQSYYYGSGSPLTNTLDNLDTANEPDVFDRNYQPAGTATSGNTVPNPDVFTAKLKDNWEQLVNNTWETAQTRCFDGLMNAYSSNTVGPYMSDQIIGDNIQVCPGETPVSHDPPSITKRWKTPREEERVKVVPGHLYSWIGASEPVPLYAMLFGITGGWSETAYCSMKVTCSQPPVPPGPPSRQCSNTSDDDNDGKVDAADPGCLSGLSGAYDPNDNDETDPVVVSPPQPPQNPPPAPPPGPLDLPLNDPYLPGGALHDPANMRLLFNRLKKQYEDEQAINCNYGEPQRTLICGLLLAAVEAGHQQETSLVDAAQAVVDQFYAISWLKRQSCSFSGRRNAIPGTTCGIYWSLVDRVDAEAQTVQQHRPIRDAWLGLRNEISTWCTRNQLPQGQFPGL